LHTLGKQKLNEACGVVAEVQGLPRVGAGQGAGSKVPKVQGSTSGSEVTEVVEVGPREEVAWNSELTVLVDGCTRRHYVEGPLDEKCGGRMTQAPLEESDQAPLGVHPKSTSHLPPRCKGASQTPEQRCST